MAVLAFKGPEPGVVAQVYNSVTQGVEASATTSNQDFEARLHNLARTHFKHTNTHIHTNTHAPNKKLRTQQVRGRTKTQTHHLPRSPGASQPAGPLLWFGI